MTQPETSYSYEGPITFREGDTYESDDRLYLASEAVYAEGRVLSELATEIAKALHLTDPYYGTGRSEARVRITVEELSDLDRSDSDG